MSSIEIHAPNYTQVPNIIFDYWMEVLTPAEFKVLLCICRKTFGWGKEYDNISLKQIEKMTGLSRLGIMKNIEHLIELGLILKIKSKTSDGDDAPNKFAINVVCLEKNENSVGVGRQLSLPPEVNTVGVGRQLSLPPVGNSVAQGVGNSVAPQKKDNTKERPTKGGRTPQTPAHSPSSFSSPQGKQPKASTSSAKPPISAAAANLPLEPKPARSKKDPKIAVRPHVELYASEMDYLIASYGQPQVDWMLDKLEAHKASTGKKYVSDYATMYTGGWVQQAYQEHKNRGSGSKSPEGAQSNADLATQAQKEYVSQYSTIHVGPSYIEFTPTAGQLPPDVLQFSSHGFSEQLKSLLHKRGYKKRG